MATRWSRSALEISEQLDVIPEQLRVVQHQRVKYACPCCDLGIKVTAPAAHHPSWPVQRIGAGVDRHAASISSACRSIARPAYCVASAATSRPTRSPPAWFALASRSARDQPDARCVARRRTDLLRRDDVPGTERERAKAANEELPLGADDRTRESIRCFSEARWTRRKLADKLFTRDPQGARF